MSVEHHNLLHEFPEFREEIHELKTTDLHFRRLLNEYHDLTKDVEKMENEVAPASTDIEHAAKQRRAQLKDELYQMLATHKKTA